MESTTLASLLTNVNYFKDIEGQSDSYKVMAIDTALNEVRRNNRLPQSIRKSSLRIFKDIQFYKVENGHDSLLTINNEDVDSYANAASYFNTDLNQFIEMVKENRNLLTQTYINGEMALGVKNFQDDIPQTILDQASDTSNYSEISGATLIGTNSLNQINSQNTISFNIVDGVIENTYDNAISDASYHEKYYIRTAILKVIPTSITLRLQTDSSNYIEKTITAQVNGLPFTANDVNYLGFALEEGTEVGTFDSSNIASSRIIFTDYTGIIYLGFDSINSFLSQQYWYYSKYLIKTSTDTLPSKEQFFNYTSNDFDITDSIIGPSKWLDVIIKKAEAWLTLGVENEYLRASIAASANKAESRFDSEFPNQQPQMTIVTQKFNNDPETINYVH